MSEYECPFVEWKETDYDVISGHSYYEPVCAKAGMMNARCYQYYSKYCKIRQGDFDQQQTKMEHPE